MNKPCLLCYLLIILGALGMFWFPLFNKLWGIKHPIFFIIWFVSAIFGMGTVASILKSIDEVCQRTNEEDED
jgi:uncharacterized membrane protein YuzA (DUF378 family)